MMAADRLILEATLVTETALHVGSAASDGIVADLDVVRDGLDRPIIPGTSLAGVLRTRLFAYGEMLDVWQRWFGTDAATPWVTGHSKTAPASRLSVFDATPVADAPRVERRDHVAIDRRTGTAVDRLKYDRVIVAAGTRFSARLVVVSDGDGSGDLTMLALVARLVRSGLTVGGGATRGLGRVIADGEVTVRRERRATRDGVLQSLRDRVADRRPAGPEQLPENLPALQETVCCVSIGWHPDRSMYVRQGGEGLYVDTVPLTTMVTDGRLTFVLPGSSLKGALRSAAERIVRTVLRQDPPEIPAASHAQQIAAPVVDLLFGAAKERAEGTGARGRMEIADVHAEVTFAEDLSAMPLGRDAGPRGEVDTGDGRVLQVVASTHVALDRWTQGVAEGPFDVLEAIDVPWGPIVLLIDATTFDERQRLAAGVLLRRVLDELRAGDLPLGGMTTRGHGAVHVDTIRLTQPEALGLAHDLTFVDGRASIDAFCEALDGVRA